MFRPQCVYGYGPNCVPQKGGPQQLDVLGDRLMFRLAYRNFGSYASLLLNHTVVTPDARDGVRWYEVRIPKGAAPSVYQQGTYAPTDAATGPLWRWMGSIAQDRRATSRGLQRFGAQRLPVRPLHRPQRRRPAGPDDPDRAWPTPAPARRPRPRAAGATTAT